MTRFYLTMTADEWLALVQAANRNCREPKQEARHILRSALIGNPPDPPDQSQKTHNGAAVRQDKNSAVVQTL